MTEPLPAMSLIGVRTAQFAGETIRPGVPKAMQLRLAVNWAAGEDGAVGVTFDAAAQLYDVDELPDDGAPAEEAHLATINASLVVTYQADGPLPEGTAPAMHNFVATRGITDMTPYLREAFSSIAVRLGYPAVTMDSVATPELLPIEQSEPRSSS